ncbi:hypothetical protein H4R99_007415 [Coemansia sp. RSA 1722]|nr:hypothetical protein LPJ57_002133 [Coemansia sp. RSA 486]KAJ2226943.1 hypothetical protein IWW45_007238 [Coemansia sp. RSA 485]KAJ2589570.1 hypothetical protein H4R99_007415 [Coemansia sp. RSA 1722]
MATVSSTSAGTEQIVLTALPKISSSSSLASLLSSEHGASTSSTVCEPIEKLANDEYTGCGVHSREIAFVDLEPTELNIGSALGQRDSRTIECLRINGCRMDSLTLSALVEDLCCLELPNLHTVDLSKNQLSGSLAGASLAKLMDTAPLVRTLSLGWNNLSLADLKDLTGSLLVNVELLDLRSNPLLVPALKTTSKSRRRRSSASTVDASDDSCDMSWVYALVDSMPALSHVLLAQAKIADKALITLLDALTRSNTSVEYIGLEWLSLGSRLASLGIILQNVASSRHSTSSASLHLNFAANNLGDRGVDVITSSSATMTSLTLACNFITERGTAMLAKWLPKSGLISLDLSDNHFGDQGIASLVTTHGGNMPDTHYTRVKSLGLNSCCLSDASLRIFADALLCHWAPLESLRILRNSRMSPGAIVSM